LIEIFIIFVDYTPFFYIKIIDNLKNQAFLTWFQEFKIDNKARYLQYFIRFSFEMPRFRFC